AARVSEGAGCLFHRRIAACGAAPKHARAAGRSRSQLMYVAVKGGEKAIDNAHALLARKRRGDASIPALTVDQIREQLPLAVTRVMGEGSLFDEELAALAIKQAAGDLLE